MSSKNLAHVFIPLPQCSAIPARWRFPVKPSPSSALVSSCNQWFLSSSPLFLLPSLSSPPIGRSCGAAMQKHVFNMLISLGALFWRVGVSPMTPRRQNYGTPASSDDVESITQLELESSPNYDFQKNVASVPCEPCT